MEPWQPPYLPPWLLLTFGSDTRAGQQPALVSVKLHNGAREVWSCRGVEVLRALPSSHGATMRRPLSAPSAGGATCTRRPVCGG
jgi:hypothetical protein